MAREMIKKLSEQLDEALATLHELRAACGCDALPQDAPKPRKRHDEAYKEACRIYGDRKARSDHFGNSDIFGEPAWDILLDVYIHQFQNEEVSVKSACIGSGAPATTALRWLSLLERQGLICSTEDPIDQRRRFIRLTAEGYESMTRYLNHVACHGGEQQS